MNLDEAIARLRRCLDDQVDVPIGRTGARVVDADVLRAVLDAIEGGEWEDRSTLKRVVGRRIETVSIPPRPGLPVQRRFVGPWKEVTA